MGSLENVLLLLLERHAQLEKLRNDFAEFLEEYIVVLGVSHDVLLELLVFNQSHIGGQHHQRLCGLVFVLLGSIPLIALLVYS
jgi:hypothetical protein